MDERNVTYNRMERIDAEHGQKFEWEVTTLAYLRCRRLHEQWKKDNKNGIKSFSLANNVKGAGKFDDVVVRVEYVINSQIKNKVIFVQFKHIEEPIKNSKKRLKTYLQDSKSINDYYKSLVEIIQCRNQLNTEVFSDEHANIEKDPCTTSEPIQNNLKCFIDGENVNIEVLFYSNIEIDEHCKMYQMQTNNGNGQDITADIFNTANIMTHGLRLRESTAPDSIDSENNENIRFVDAFRVFANQQEPETLINHELKLISNSLIDIEYLRTLTIEEIRNHFTKNPCTALTEKTETILNVKNLLTIQKNAAKIIDDFQTNFRLQKIFEIKTISSFEESLGEKKLIRVKTNFQKLEKIKFLQFFITLILDYTCLFLSSEINIQEWISARETRIYSKLKKVYIYSQMHINFENVKLKLNEIVVEILDYPKQIMRISNYLDQFSDETQNFILNTNIVFQGVQADIKSVFKDSWRYLFNENLICNILQNKLIKLYRPIPDLGFYISRDFVSESLNFELIKRIANKFKLIKAGIVLISENIKCIPGHDDVYKEFENMKDVRIFTRNHLNEQQNPYHLFYYCNNDFKWIYSFGKPSFSTENQILPQDVLFNDIKTKITILSDVAGMGKTTTLLSLTRIYKEKNPSHWVFFIELNKHMNSLKKIKQIPTTDSVLKFIGSNLLSLKSLELNMFTNACNETGNVALFFDGFDEISPDAEKTFPLLLTTLETTKISKIFVSSRPNHAHILEETILHKSIKLNGLTKVEIERALEGYLMQMMKRNKKKCDESLLTETVKETMMLFNSEEKILSDVLTNPCHIEMTAEKLYEFVLQRKQRSKAQGLCTLNLSALYENLLYSHAKRFLVEKCKMSLTNLKPDQKKRLIQEKWKGAEEFACQTVIPDLIQCSNMDMSNELSTLCDDLGLIQSKNPPYFQYRTIAEYLAAKYIVNRVLPEKNISEYGDTLYSVFVEEKFITLRKFINLLLKSMEFKNSSKNQARTKSSNKFGDLPRHVAESEGNDEISNLLQNNERSLIYEKDVHGKNPLNLACLEGKNEVLKVPIANSDNAEKSCYISKFNNLHSALRIGCTEVMLLLWKHDCPLLNIQHERRETPLNSAWHNDKLLTHSNASINIRNSYADISSYSSSHICCIEIMDLIFQREMFYLCEQNIGGLIPLQYTYYNDGSTNAMNFLLINSDHSANIGNRYFDTDMVNIYGDTVLPLASTCGHMDVTQPGLKRDDTLFFMQDKCGRTKSHDTRWNAIPEATKYLATYTNCLLNIFDFGYNNALFASKASNRVEMLQLRLRHENYPLLSNSYRTEKIAFYTPHESDKIYAVKSFFYQSNCSKKYNNFSKTAHYTATRNDTIEIGFENHLLQSDERLLWKRKEVGAKPFCVESNIAVKHTISSSDKSINIRERHRAEN